MILITKGYVIENSAATLLARVQNETGAYIQQADVSSLTCKVFDLESSTPSTAIATPTFVVASVVFNSLQLDSRWDVDTTGYNMAVGLAGSNFPNGNTTYRVEIKVTPTAGDAFYVLFDLAATDILSE